MNKIIRFGLILPTHNKIFLFLALLISLNISNLSAQTQPGDSLKRPIVDSVAVKEDNSETLEDKIKYAAADSLVAIPGSGKALLYGKAKVDYGSMNIEAEFIELDYTRNLITAYGKKDSLGKNVGNPVFKDGDQTMEADKIMYNMKTKKGKIFNALTKQGELLVIGGEIKKDSTNIIYMKDMQCIPCKDADARTIFRAPKAKIIPDDKIVTGPMYLEIGGAPTPLGLPFGYFPNTKKQHNGILLPTFGNSPQRGFNLQNGGYYWGINDKTDMIIRGTIYANGSWGLSTTNDYNILYKSRGSVSLQYNRFNNGDKDVPQSFSKQSSYQINWQHAQDNKSNPSIRFSASVNFVNNQTYNRLTTVNTGQYLQNTFQSNVNFTKTYKLSSLSINATHSQNSLTHDMTITLPQLTYNVNRFFPFKRANAVKPNVFDKLGISYLLESRNTLSGKDSLIFKGKPLDSLNYGIKHTIPISTNFTVFKYITVTPGLNFSSEMYTKTVRKEFYNSSTPFGVSPGSAPAVSNPSNPSGKVVAGDIYNQGIKTTTENKLAIGYDAAFSTAFNTQIYFDYMFKKGKVKQIRHLLIPTLTYNYRPDFGSQQFGFYKKVTTDTLGHTQKYSIFEKGIFGGPALGKVNGLGINLNNTFDAKLKQNTDTGVTYKKVSILQNLGLSTNYNFAADSFKMSNISLTARTVLFKNINLTLNSAFDPYAYDKVNNREINKFVYQSGNKLARFTTGNISINTSIGSNMLAAARKAKQQAPDMTNGAERGAKNDLDNEEKLPWNLTVSYNLGLSNPNDKKIHPSHTLNFSGDVKPTKFWKVGVTSGFDFTTQRLSYTSFNIYRDLKCWEASIRWVPFGYNKSYSIAINLKSSMLSEFKIPRQRQYLDTFH